MLWRRTETTVQQPPKSALGAGATAPAASYPVQSAADLLRAQHALITRIKLTAGLPDQAYEQLVLPAVVGFAEFVQLIPATRDRHHYEPGGLFQHGSETALLALQLADSRVIGGGLTAERRRVIESRWRLAAFYAGLCHDLGKVATDLDVLSRKGDRWDPLRGSLSAWVATNGQQHYSVTWRPIATEGPTDESRYRPFSGLLTQHVVPPPAFSFIAEGGAAMVREMLLTIAGLVPSGKASTLQTVVREAKSGSIDRDTRQRGGVRPTGTIGLPLERIVIDLMRDLVQGGQWTVNTETSRVCCTPRGVFLDWEKASKELRAAGARAKTGWLPKDPLSLAELLVDHKLAVPPPTQTGTGYWKVKWPDGEERDALRLAAAELLFTQELPGQIDLPVEPCEESPNAPQHHTDALPETHNVAPAAEVGLQTEAAEKDANQGGQTELTLSDASPEKSQAAPERDDARPPEPLPSQEEARKWLKNHGAGGNILAAIAEDLTTGKRRAGREVFWTSVAGKETLAIAYPDAVQGYGMDPVKIITDATGRGWLVSNPENPKSALIEVTRDGVKVKALGLSAEITARVVAAAGTALQDTMRKTPPGQEVQQQGGLTPAVFLADLAEASRRGELPFVLVRQQDGVRAPYPEVFQWYARRAPGVSFSQVSMMMMRREMAVTRNARPVQAEAAESRLIVFREQVLGRLFDHLPTADPNKNGVKGDADDREPVAEGV